MLVATLGQLQQSVTWGNLMKLAAVYSAVRTMMLCGTYISVGQQQREREREREREGQGMHLALDGETKSRR